MRQHNLFAWLAGILIVTLLAGYLSFFNGTLPIINRDVSPRLGLDLVGGLQLVLLAEPTGDQPVSPADLEAARNIIEDRASGTGASEPVVQTAEGNRILVELPGIKNLDDARAVIQQTAFLEILDGGTTPPADGTFVCTTLGKPKPEQLRSTTAATAVPTVAPTGEIQCYGYRSGGNSHPGGKSRGQPHLYRFPVPQSVDHYYQRRPD